MVSRDPRAARLLGLWTAAWLFGLLLAGLLWIGDPSVQWPVLLVPVLWGLVALRPRRRPRESDPDDATRTDTVQRPALPPPGRGRD